MDFRLGAVVDCGGRSNFAIADKVGAKEILFWEADYIDAMPNAAELKSQLRNRAETCPMQSDEQRGK